jgi:hypothetical protein
VAAYDEYPENVICPTTSSLTNENVGEACRLSYSHRPDLFGKKRFYTKFGEKQLFLCRKNPTFQAAKMTKIFFTEARKSFRFSIF